MTMEENAVEIRCSEYWGKKYYIDTGMFMELNKSYFDRQQLKRYIAFVFSCAVAICLPDAHNPETFIYENHGERQKKIDLQIFFLVKVRIKINLVLSLDCITQKFHFSHTKIPKQIENTWLSNQQTPLAKQKM